MLGVRLDPETEAGLARLAKQTRRAKSDIAREAVRRYIARHDAAYLAEARRQSIAAAAADAERDWDFYEAAEAEDRRWS